MFFFLSSRLHKSTFFFLFQKFKKNLLLLNKNNLFCFPSAHWIVLCPEVLNLTNSSKLLRKKRVTQTISFFFLYTFYTLQKFHTLKKTHFYLTVSRIQPKPTRYYYFNRILLKYEMKYFVLLIKIQTEENRKKQTHNKLRS